MLLDGFALPLENTKGYAALGAFPRWVLPLVQAKRSSLFGRPSLSLSISLRFLYIVLLDLAPPLR